MTDQRIVMGLCSLCGGAVTYRKTSWCLPDKGETEPECETCHAVQSCRIISMSPKPKPKNKKGKQK